MRVLYLSVILIIIDQLSKIFVKGFKIPFLGIDVSGMRYGQSFSVIGDFFQITFVENFGMAFGIGVGNTAKLFLSLFTVVASIGILIYLYQNRNQRLIERIALALIFAGAVGNLIDRVFYGVFYGYAPIFYGKVVDFFNVDFFDFSLFGRTYERWPIFNVADAAVTVGVILVLIFHRKLELESKTQKDDESVSENDLAIEANNTEIADSISEDEEDGTHNGPDKRA